MKEETKLDIICLTTAYLANAIGLYWLWGGLK